MTAMTGLPLDPKGESLSDVLARINALLAENRTFAQWWVDLVGQLDHLGTRLVSRHSEVVGRTPFVRQITTDAPHMTSRLRRLAIEQERLEHDLLQVRIMAGRAAGNPEESSTVRRAVHDLLHRMRRHEERSNEVLYDAYERDFGGE